MSDPGDEMIKALLFIIISAALLLAGLILCIFNVIAWMTFFKSIAVYLTTTWIYLFVWEKIKEGLR